MELLVENINNFKKIHYVLFYLFIKKDKKLKIKKMIIKESKYRSILGEYLLIIGLKKVFNIKYKDIEIKINEFGKPFIKNNNIHYNISHSSDYVICGFNEKSIGVDIEKIKNININDINQFATGLEKKYILENNASIFERAFEIYTLKEAYIKMRGTNLFDIKNIEFVIDGENIICNDENVNLKLIKDIENYIIAICMEK